MWEGKSLDRKIASLSSFPECIACPIAQQSPKRSPAYNDTVPSDQVGRPGGFNGKVAAVCFRCSFSHAGSRVVPLEVLAGWVSRA